MDFSTLAYASLKLKFDHELFSQEYDSFIFPKSTPIANGYDSIVATTQLNKLWAMVDPAIYPYSDTFRQLGNYKTLEYHKRTYPAWQMFQLMELDIQNVKDQRLLDNYQFGGVSLRNETLEETFHLKSGFEDLEISKWIFKNLPFKKINSIHCVSIEPTGFSTIHRDMKGLYDGKSSAGLNKVYKSGFVIINLNISNGGVPLYWSLDGEDAKNYRTADDAVYLTNDYFMHGVPVCKTRRRQIRVTGIPEDSMWDLLDHSNKVDIGKDYRYDPSYPKK